MPELVDCTDRISLANSSFMLRVLGIIFIVGWSTMSNFFNSDGNVCFYEIRFVKSWTLLFDSGNTLRRVTFIGWINTIDNMIELNGYYSMEGTQNKCIFLFTFQLCKMINVMTSNHWFQYISNYLLGFYHWTLYASKHPDALTL